jgi:hypothetical protein
LGAGRTDFLGPKGVELAARGHDRLAGGDAELERDVPDQPASAKGMRRNKGGESPVPFRKKKLPRGWLLRRLAAHCLVSSHSITSSKAGL